MSALAVPWPVIVAVLSFAVAAVCIRVCAEERRKAKYWEGVAARHLAAARKAETALEEIAEMGDRDVFDEEELLSRLPGFPDPGRTPEERGMIERLKPLRG